MKLDIGCGTLKHEGAHGIDRVALPGVDTVHDLNAFPYPFPSDSCDEIWLKDVIEHLQEPVRAMEEIYRILQPGGIVHVRVVHWTHRNAYTDPTHIRFFDQATWDFFTNKQRAYYTSAQFDMVSLKLNYDYGVWKRLPFPRLLNFLAYFLNNIVESMQVTLRKPV